MATNIDAKRGQPMLANLDLLEPKQRSRLKRLAPAIQAQFLRDCLHPMGRLSSLSLSFVTCSVIIS